MATSVLEFIHPHTRQRAAIRLDRVATIEEHRDQVIITPLGRGPLIWPRELTFDQVLALVGPPLVLEQIVSPRTNLPTRALVNLGAVHMVWETKDGWGNCFFGLGEQPVPDGFVVLRPYAEVLRDTLAAADGSADDGRLPPPVA